MKSGSQVPSSDDINDIQLSKTASKKKENQLVSKFKLNVLSPSFQAQSQHTTTNHSSQRKLGALQLQLSVYLAAVHLSVELISAAALCGTFPAPKRPLFTRTT